MRKEQILKRVISLIVAVCMSVAVLFNFTGCIYVTYKRQYSRNLIKAIEANDMEKLQALVDKGGDLDMLPHAKLLADGLLNITPLMMAVRKSNFEAVKILVEAGADVNINVNYNYYPPLLEAIYRWRDIGSFDIVYYLLDKGANIHQKEKGSMVYLRGKTERSV